MLNESIKAKLNNDSLFKDLEMFLGCSIHSGKDNVHIKWWSDRIMECLDGNLLAACPNPVWAVWDRPAEMYIVADQVLKEAPPPTKE